LLEAVIGVLLLDEWDVRYAATTPPLPPALLVLRGLKPSNDATDHLAVPICRICGATYSPSELRDGLTDRGGCVSCNGSQLRRVRPSALRTLGHLWRRRVAVRTPPLRFPDADGDAPRLGQLRQQPLATSTSFAVAVLEQQHDAALGILVTPGAL
jgi:hypothetical protein